MHALCRKGGSRPPRGLPRTYDSFIMSKIDPLTPISKAFIGSELVRIEGKLLESFAVTPNLAPYSLAQLQKCGPKVASAKIIFGARRVQVLFI
jgi:hypothetical protein